MSLFGVFFMGTVVTDLSGQVLAAAGAGSSLPPTRQRRPATDHLEAHVCLPPIHALNLQQLLQAIQVLSLCTVGREIQT